MEGYPTIYDFCRVISDEQNYTTIEREMLAVVHALRVWRCYLEGVFFEVETDHKCKTFFQSQPNLLRRQARWSEFLQRFGKFH
jgi:ribosomal protein L31